MSSRSSAEVSAPPSRSFASPRAGAPEPRHRARPARALFARLAGSFADPPSPPPHAPPPPPPAAEHAPSPAPLFELALKKAQSEYYRVVRIRGDGRCMFRALAVGLAHLKRENLGAAGEEREADQLRLAVAESMCRSPEKRKRFDAAVTAVSFEMPIETYCKRILKPAFWGGEPELLVLAEILRRRIVVYIPASKVKSAAKNTGYVPIQTYGEEYAVTKKGNPKPPVRLLYNGQNHYDVLLE